MTTATMIGMDPEFLVLDAKKPDRALDLRGIFPGTKDEPVDVDGYDGWTQQVDGTALELGCRPRPYAVTPSAYVPNPEPLLLSRFMSEAYEVASHLVNTKVGDAGTLATVDHAKLPKNVKWDDLEHGCDPDVNAYQISKDENQKVVTSGWHIHFGLEFKIPHEVFVTILDAVVAPVLTLLPVTPRSFQQGHLGTYRIKEYGLEYRTPGTNIYDIRDPFSKAVYEAWKIFDIIQSDPTDHYRWWSNATWGQHDSFHNLRPFLGYYSLCNYYGEAGVMVL